MRNRILQYKFSFVPILNLSNTGEFEFINYNFVYFFSIRCFVIREYIMKYIYLCIYILLLGNILLVSSDYC